MQRPQLNQQLPPLGLSARIVFMERDADPIATGLNFLWSVVAGVVQKRPHFHRRVRAQRPRELKKFTKDGLRRVVGPAATRFEL